MGSTAYSAVRVDWVQRKQTPSDHTWTMPRKSHVRVGALRTKPLSLESADTPEWTHIREPTLEAAS